MLKRLAAMTAVVFVALTLHATSAVAQQYPPQPAAITASAQAATPGGTATFTASGFQPGTTVTFTIFSDPVVLGTAVADANGVATLTAKIPAGIALGNHTVTASGVDPTGKPLTVSMPFVVAAKVVNGLPVVPRTGASSTTATAARAGLGLVAAGALMVLVTRQRRVRAAAAAA